MSELLTPQALIALEARLVDEQRFDEWLDLFAPDGRYWVPLAGAAQREDQAHNALADEDHLLLALRVERLKGARAHSLQARSRCQHVLQTPESLGQDTATGCSEWRTPFLYTEVRGECQVMLTGTVLHRLVDTPQGWRIRLKRVDLLDAGSPLPAIQFFP